LEQHIRAPEGVEIDQIKKTMLQIGLAQEPLRRLMALDEREPGTGLQRFEIGG
jgi:hypothetical protein